MKLFVIEGVDGAGKSTQIRLLREYFTERGLRCEYLHFPRTMSPYFGELIARFLRGEFGTIGTVDPYLVALLYAGDRKDASELISAWLNEGKVVLLDRYTYSNIAYQCAKVNDPSAQENLKNWILGLEFDHFSIPRPNLNIFLDVPAAFTEEKLSGKRTGDDRTYLNGSVDIHEDSMDFQRKVRDIYVRAAESDNNLVLINCAAADNKMLSPEEIFKLIIRKLKERNLI